MNTNHARKWEHTNASHPITREKQVTVKIKQSWITKGEKMLYSLVGVFLLIAGYFIVSYSSSTDTLNRELQSLEGKIEEQKVVNESLLFEVKELSKPERITKVAKENGLKIEDGEIKHAKSINNN